MDGFKNTTKMKYFAAGGMVDGYAKGGSTKPAMAKPMMKGGDAKPMMDKPKMGMGGSMMATGKPLARGGQSKAPVKKSEGGMMAAAMRKQSPTGGGIGNVSDRELRQMRSLAEQEMRMLEERFPIDRLVDRLRSRMPSAGESVASGNRMSKMMAEEARAMGLKKGGLAAMPKKGK